MQTKELILNGKLLARYQCNHEAVWVRPYIMFRFLPAETAQHFIVALISEIEQIEFKFIGELQ